MKTNLWPDHRRWALLIIGLAIGPAGAVQAQEPAGRVETLQAIRAVENPHGTSRPGRYGELGPYQFRRSTWRTYTQIPFEHALERDHSDEIAVRHYEWIKRGLLRNGLAVDPYNIALAWNGGLMAAVRGRASAAAHDYAARVNNLAREFQASRIVGMN